jgi:hypothetical protein
MKNIQNEPFLLRADPGSLDSGTKSWPGQAFEHDADHGEANEGCSGSCVALEVSREAAVVADPGERALDNPSLGQDDEAMRLVSFDDLQLPGAGLGDGSGRFGSLIAGIGEDALDKREQASGAPIEDQPGAVAILQIGAVDDNVQQKAERVDKNMALAARDFLARIKALWVERGAPF